MDHLNQCMVMIFFTLCHVLGCVDPFLLDDNSAPKKVIIHLPVHVKHITRTVYKVIEKPVDKGGGEHKHHGEVIHHHVHSGYVDHKHKHDGEAEHEHHHIGLAEHAHKHKGAANHKHAHFGTSHHKHHHTGHANHGHGHIGSFGHGHKHIGTAGHKHHHFGIGIHNHDHKGTGHHDHSHSGHYNHEHEHDGKAGHKHEHFGHFHSDHKHHGDFHHGHDHVGSAGHKHAHNGKFDHGHNHKGHFSNLHGHTGHNQHNHHHDGSYKHDHKHSGNILGNHLHDGRSENDHHYEDGLLYYGRTNSYSTTAVGAGENKDSFEISFENPATHFTSNKDSDVMLNTEPNDSYLPSKEFENFSGNDVEGSIVNSEEHITLNNNNNNNNYRTNAEFPLIFDYGPTSNEATEKDTWQPIALDFQISTTSVPLPLNHNSFPIVSTISDKSLQPTLSYEVTENVTPLL